ncbi:MAG: hypothetical protein K6L81_02450 [Agarilytica sp.]
MKQHSTRNAILQISEVSELTNIGQKSLKQMCSDGRFPKPLKRKHRNTPYRWRRDEVMSYLQPSTQKNIDDQRLREIIQEELIKILRLTTPASR